MKQGGCARITGIAVLTAVILFLGAVPAAAEQKTYTNTIGMEFVYIAPGTFWMGSPEDEVGRDIDETRHQVTLTKGYYMQTTEVTQGQWKALLGNNPSHFINCGDNCPVEKVSWDDVQAFILRLNQREGSDGYGLPTEAEWEYACRAGTESRFAFGKCLSTSQANYDGSIQSFEHFLTCPMETNRPQTVAVGSLGKNAWGLYDMHGNVAEWCDDKMGDYPSSSVTDPTSPRLGATRVLRGGSFYSYAKNCRSANRYATTPVDRYHGYGFRLVLRPSQ